MQVFFENCVLRLRRSEADDETEIVGLDLGFVCRTVSADRSAFFASVDDHIALFRIHLHADRFELTAAIRRAVAGVYVKVERPQAKGTVVS